MDLYFPSDEDSDDIEDKTNEIEFFNEYKKNGSRKRLNGKFNY